MIEIQQGWKQIGIFSKFLTNIFFVFLREHFPEEDEKYIRREFGKYSYLFSTLLNFNYYIS